MFDILYVQEVVTTLYSNLPYKFVHYFVDRRYLVFLVAHTYFEKDPDLRELN